MSSDLLKATWFKISFFFKAPDCGRGKKNADDNPGGETYVACVCVVIMNNMTNLNEYLTNFCSNYMS